MSSSAEDDSSDEVIEIICICWISINLLVITLVLIKLCYKKSFVDIDSSIFLQVILTMASLIFNGVKIYLFYTIYDGDNQILDIIQRLHVLTFLCSQWVFIYQYLRVAILMPFLLVV